MCFSVLATALGTKSLVPRLPTATQSQRLGVFRLFKDMRLALSSRSFRSRIAGYAIADIPVGVGAALRDSTPMYTYFWRIPAASIPIISVSALISLIVGYALAPLALRRLEKKQALCLTAVVWTVLAAAPVTLHYANAFPAPDTALLVVALTAFACLGTLMGGPRIIAVQSMLADVADEVELDGGKRQAGALFGVYSFILKATYGVGASLAGVVLDLIHFPHPVRKAANIPHDALFQLSR